MANVQSNVGLYRAMKHLYNSVYLYEKFNKNLYFSLRSVFIIGKEAGFCVFV